MGGWISYDFFSQDAPAKKRTEREESSVPRFYNSYSITQTEVTTGLFHWISRRADGIRREMFVPRSIEVDTWLLDRPRNYSGVSLTTYLIRNSNRRTGQSRTR